MTIIIPKSNLKYLDYDLDQEIERYKKAREDHALTVDIPAPTTTPLVLDIINAGGYEIKDDSVYENPNPEYVPEPENILPESPSEPIELPTVITAAQAKIVLLRKGLLKAVSEAVKNDPEDEIWFEYALTWERDNPRVIHLGEALGLSPAYIDNLFNMAMIVK